MKSRLLRWFSVPLLGNWEWTIAVAAALVALAALGASWWDGP
jgi:hypothetical protein